MPRLPVRFTYVTGIKADLFSAGWLKGSWLNGRHSIDWSSTPMSKVMEADGCPAFTQTIEFSDDEVGQTYEWGVELDAPVGKALWAIMTEANRHNSARRVRSFHLAARASNGSIQHEFYYLNQSRRLGAQKFFGDGKGVTPGIRFAVWAPNAKAVEVYIGNLWSKSDSHRRSLIDPNIDRGSRATRSVPRPHIWGGYIGDDGAGSHPNWGPFQLYKHADGVWLSDPDDPHLVDFLKFDHAPYMFRVIKDDGTIVYRTDLYSRCQIGGGLHRPTGYCEGPTGELDGSVSCSVVVDPDQVTLEFLEPIWPETKWISQTEFFTHFPADPKLHALDLQDLVIYELHVGALGATSRGPLEAGTLDDALAFLDYLVELGVNAVELLPLSEFGGGGAGWGYATSHYFAIEYSGGGRDQYKWFVRECHKRGLVVILDVVYNHYSHDANRAEWMYDTNTHERNVYYWYEGQSRDYRRFSEGGYVDNVSTAWAPRYSEEMVRSMFISSAITLATEFEVDGFRVDQTTSIHSYNALHADGRPLPHANAFGSKMLRELTRSLKFVKPSIMLVAEDHSNWDGVTLSSEEGGLGFHAAWYADFYHHLIGDTDKGSDYAKLIKTAGLGDDRPLAMDYFAGALKATAGRKVVYHESHDEAGNGTFTDRTINVAVNGAPLVDATRRFAEARCRFAAGVTILSAGIPMFLFGEEVGAEKKFKYGEVLPNREDMHALRYGSGRNLFRYYSELIRLRLAHRGLRSRNINCIYVHNDHRLLLFHRWSDDDDLLVIASLNNRPFNNPTYLFRSEGIPSGSWREIFNSDAAIFGGDSIGNAGATLEFSAGFLECVVPANGILVFERVSQ